MVIQRFRLLAVDYDGTLATDGLVTDNTVTALRKARESTRKLVLVTGRTLADLQRQFAEGLALFDRVVAENGATIFEPHTGHERLLAEPPPAELATTLRQRDIPLSTGRVIVATREPHETTALEVIHQLGLDLQLIFNKGAVMILPVGVSKASGLQAALDELELSVHNTVGIGDAENDHAFLQLCECSVAVANALRSVKRRVDFVTAGTHGDGVAELIDRLVADDLASLDGLKRHRIALGRATTSQKPVALSPFGTRLLVSGTSRSGKSSFVLGLVEQLHEHGYQFCLVDPEGDFERLPDTVNQGDTSQAPTAEDVLEVLRRPGQSVCVSLLAVSGEHRPTYFSNLLSALQSLSAETGRPHWLIVDEVHHVMPRHAVERAPGGLASMVLVTLELERMNTLAIAEVNAVLALGRAPRRTLASAAQLMGATAPSAPAGDLKRGEGVLWLRGKKRAHLVNLVRPTLKRRRHRRKYAEGELSPEQSFYFRGPGNALNLRASNLQEFVRFAEGLDDATWQHHLMAGDYAHWVLHSLSDRKLARDITRLAASPLATDPTQSRSEVRKLIETRYAPPA